MQTIKHINGVVQSKEEFLLQELEGLILKVKLTVHKDPEEIRFQRDRVAMLEAIIEDCWRRTTNAE